MSFLEFIDRNKKTLTNFLNPNKNCRPERGLIEANAAHAPNTVFKTETICDYWLETAPHVAEGFCAQEKPVVAVVASPEKPGKGIFYKELSQFHASCAQN